MNALKSPVTEQCFTEKKLAYVIHKTETTQPMWCDWWMPWKVQWLKTYSPPALKMHLVWEKIWPKNLISGTLHNDVSNAVVKLDRKKGTNYGTGCLFFVILQCNFYRLVKIWLGLFLRLGSDIFRLWLTQVRWSVRRDLTTCSITLDIREIQGWRVRLHLKWVSSVVERWQILWQCDETDQKWEREVTQVRKAGSTMLCGKNLRLLECFRE